MPGMTAAYPQAAFPNPTFIPNTYEVFISNHLFKQKIKSFVFRLL